MRRDDEEAMTVHDDPRERWALVLGASSGFGGAAATAWARAGFNILGVHLDLRGTIAAADAVRETIAASGAQVVFHNVNAADDEKRASVVAAISELFAERRRAGEEPYIGAMLHSLAFGATLPYIAEDGGRELSRKQLEMTSDVMAHSMLYWVRDLFQAGLLGRGSRLFAMTSEGATLAVPTYGAVSAAKAALEAHVRQLALELMPHGITVNAIRAGVTDTPALHRIPNWEHLLGEAHRRNPAGRVTRPEDVADALVALASPLTHWMTGNVIGVDGGEVMGQRDPNEL
jgi:NAD(P)-dependent dehydrogenase (short-subunit alcohol dehydrogenase family)